MEKETKQETTVFINPEVTLEDEDVTRTEITSREDAPKRGQWDRKCDFILSLIGYSVGVSNLWRFPYLCLRNGGGAFLFPYFAFLFLAGIPLFYMEVCLGQFSATSPIFVWRLCPLFRGLGWCSSIVSGLTSIYYVAVLAWVLVFLVNSFHSTLPWSSCGNWWNTDSCIDPYIQNGTASNMTPITLNNVSLSDSNMSNYNWTLTDTEGTTAAEEFWQHYVLRKSIGLEDVGGIQPHLVGGLFASWLLVFLCLMKGVKSLGKVVYVTALLPYLLLTILLVRGLLLPGAVDGIKFYLYPEFSRLLSPSVWIEAAIQVFFSLGPAWGTLITMSSFNSFHNNCFRDTIIASITDGLTSFYSGFVVFSVVGFMAKEANVTVTDVASQGPGLALVAYPEAITKLPLPQLWAVLFFLMLLMLGMDTQFGLIESLVAGIVDAKPRIFHHRRVWVTAGVSTVCFLLGLPITLNGGIYIFQLMDWFTSAFCLFVYSFIECIVIGWIYGVERFCSDIHLMLGQRPGLVMKFSWCISSPIIVLTVFIATVSSYKMPTYDGYTYPPIARVMGFFFSMLPLIPIPLFMIWELCKAEGPLLQRLVTTLKPDKKWLPAQKEYAATYKNNQHYFELPIKALLPCRKH